MLFTSGAREVATVQSSRPATEPVASVYIEESPCVVIAAVKVDFDIAPPRNMHEWLT